MNLYSYRLLKVNKELDYNLKKIKYILINSPLPYIVEQNTASDDILIKFTRICQNSKYRNALNYFELGGLFALCNESNFEGYYTIGNSLDICVLFDRIKNHMKKIFLYLIIIC